jgi:HK97 family phage portal protein
LKQHTPLGIRLLNKAANQFGFSVVKNSVPYSLLQLFGMSLVWGRWNSKDYITKGYMVNASLYAIINRITKTASTAPFKVYRVKDEKKLAKYKAWTGTGATKESMMNAMRIKALVYEEDNKHPLNELIQKPNPWQGGADFTANSVGFRLLTGNRFLLSVQLDMGANMGQTASVVNLPPDDVAVKTDGTLFGVSSYILSVGQQIELPKESVIHSKYWNPNIDTQGSHLKGLSPLSAGERNLERSEKAEMRSVTMLKNQGAAGVLFNKAIGDWSPEMATQIKDKINQDVLGLDNAGKITAANGDLGYLNFGLNAQEMNLLELEKYSLQQLCNIYGVPYILFNADSATYNNIQEAKKELISMAVVPELSALRDDWNAIAKSFKGDDIYVDYDLSVFPELQEDMEKTMRIMKEAWWFTGNEKRLAMMADEDNEEEMMDKYLVPSGLTDISQLNPAEIERQMDRVDQQMRQDEGDTPK